MTDLAGEGADARVPGSGRASARAALESALAGIALSGAERRFLARISQWDKRSAGKIAVLLGRARQAGQREAGQRDAGPARAGERAVAGQEAGREREPVLHLADLDPACRDTLLAALMDACAYRMSGSAAADCWECAGPARCAEHAQDARRAREFAELAAELSGGISQVALASLHREQARVTIARAG